MPHPSRQLFPGNQSGVVAAALQKRRDVFWLTPHPSHVECGGRAQRRHRFVPGEERGRPYIPFLGGSLLPQTAN